MKRYSDLEFLRLSKGQKFLYKLIAFFVSIPRAVANFFIGIGRFFKKLGVGIATELADVVSTFAKGDWKTKISYVVMGFGSRSVRTRSTTPSWIRTIRSTATTPSRSCSTAC